MKIVIRRQGQVVGRFENMEDAFNARIDSDTVFRQYETDGEFGSLKEQEVVRYGTGYADKIREPRFMMTNGVMLRTCDKIKYSELN